MKHFGFLLVILAFLPMMAMGQNDASWNKVDSLLDKQYYSQAYSEAQSLFDKAVKNGNSRQSLVGAHYLARISDQFMENSADSAFARNRRLLPSLNSFDQALCRMLLADYYSSYYNMNSYRYRSNAVSDDPDLDYSLWHASRLRDTVFSLVSKALSNPRELQQASSETLGPLAETSDGSDGDLTPTVYDVVVRKALEVLENLQPAVVAPSEIDRPALLYATCGEFEKVKVSGSSPETAISRFALGLLQQSEAFHRRRGDKDGMMIEYYLYRSEHLSSFVNISDNITTDYRLEQLPRVIDFFRKGNDSRITKLHNALSSLLCRRGRYVEAIAVIDSALVLHPDSPGATECYNRRLQITQKKLSIESSRYMVSTSHQLALVKTTNIDHVYFRIIKWVDYQKGDNENKRRILLSQPVVEQWDRSIAMSGDYKQQSAYFTIPPLPQGDYLLLASSDKGFENEGIAVMNVVVEDAVFLPTVDDDMSYSGFLINRTTGKPVAGAVVTLQGNKGYNNKYHDITTAKTDRDGFYDFRQYVKTNREIVRKYDYLRVASRYNGKEIYFAAYNYESKIEDSRLSKRRHQNRFFLDRPVYKPGDTVNFTFLSYEASHYDGKVVAGEEILFTLHDINGRCVDSLRLKGDDYGVFHSAADGSGDQTPRFVLAADAVPGEWYIRADLENSFPREYIKVEAYKQPKYTVVLTKPAEERQFGKPAHIEGVAASYSAVPVSSASVKWTVTRTTRAPFWRWGWSRWWIDSGEPQVVASGTTTTADDGTFTVEFVPQPDSNSQSGPKPYFIYKVNVTVTDINGETHESGESFAVGYQNSYATVEQDAASRDDVSLKVVCRNLDGNPLSGTANVVVERLSLPQEPKLPRTESLSDNKADMPLTKAEFERLFPYYDYDGTVSDYEHWPVQEVVLTTMARTTAENPYKMNFKGMQAGAYHLSAVVVSDSGDTLTAEYYMVYEPTEAKEPVQSSLLTASVDRETCEVGETVRLRVGSRFDDVTYYLLINKDDTIYRHIVGKVGRGYEEIEIPVIEAMLGGFKIEVAAVKANRIEHYDFDISVPFSHKKLDVTFETFRNKLEPGSGEQWTVRIADAKKHQPVPAALMMTMYDHALDTYGSLWWNLHPWSQSYTSSVFGSINHSIYSNFRFAPAVANRWSSSYSYRLVTLKGIAMYSNRYSRHRMYKAVGRVKGNARGESGEVEELLLERQVDYGHDDFNGVVQLAEVSNIDSEGGAMDEAVAEEAVLNDALAAPTSASAAKADAKGNEQVQVRQNLNTLAFFKPLLRSGADGSVQISFTVPELLTEWSIEALAWTKDLKIGRLSEKAITQKPLMVVPNVPRFLRQGDTCRFSVKVSNMSGKEQDVAVALEMSNAADNSPLPMICDGKSAQTVQQQHITLRDGTSGEVSFMLAAPTSGVFVVNYKVVARTEGCSDGEQAPIPLLPNRQLVTESMSFYINGAGEKHYDFNIRPSAEQDPTRRSTLRHHSLTVDLTANPVWMAIQSLPYVARQKNPSNIYLANALYTNSLSHSIIKNNPLIETMFREWEKTPSESFQSELDRNADLKQTVMEETPWLRDAIKEEQRHRDIAHFFNRLQLENDLRKDLNRLLGAQRADGGWSWIEGGRYSSLYTTEYILESFGHLQQLGVELDSRTRKALDRAMDYVDRETYDYYRKYVKGTTFEPVNIEYLYLRSLYPDNKLSKEQQKAYNFFYSNAKKYNKSYRNLYTQALLSLVFHRHGDKELGREMAVRIREKALYSDEMGMYWRDNIGSWHWDERPIETQATIVRLFGEVATAGDSVITADDIARMQQWILKQKQTTNWSSDVSTVNAIQALLIGQGQSDGAASPVNLRPSSMSVSFGSHKLATDTSRFQIHVSQRLDGGQIGSDDGHVTLKKADAGIAWGAVYWQYFEQMDKIPASNMGITIKRTLYRIGNDSKLTVVEPATTVDPSVRHNTQPLHVGEKVRVRLEINCDRTLEYLELRDPRCAAFEPVSTASGWHWNGGLSFYCSVTNTAQTLYIDRLEKGTYYVEYDFFVNNAGTYTTAPTTIQCLYAPEFRSLCPFPQLRVQ